MSYDVGEMLRPAFTLLIAVSTVLLGVFTFGEAHLFDRLLLIILFATIIICRDNINTIGVVLAIIAGRLLEEFVWPIHHLADIPWLKVIFYALLGYGFWWLRGDYRNNILIACTYLITLLAELYWYLNEYNGPLIIWFQFLIFEALLVRWLLFMRFTFTEKWFPDKVKLNILEWQIYGIYQLFIYLQIVVIAEYIIRHLFQLDAALFYNLYPYFSHILGIYLVWLILCANARHVSQTKVNA